MMLFFRGCLKKTTPMLRTFFLYLSAPSGSIYLVKAAIQENQPFGTKRRLVSDLQKRGETDGICSDPLCFLSSSFSDGTLFVVKDYHRKTTADLGGSESYFSDNPWGLGFRGALFKNQKLVATYSRERSGWIHQPVGYQRSTKTLLQKVTLQTEDTSVKSTKRRKSKTPHPPFPRKKILKTNGTNPNPPTVFQRTPAVPQNKRAQRGGGGGGKRGKNGEKTHTHTQQQKKAQTQSTACGEQAPPGPRPYGGLMPAWRRPKCCRPPKRKRHGAHGARCWGTS